MTDEIIMKEGDDLPIRSLELQEKDGNGNRVPIDLTGSNVSFYVYDSSRDEMLIDGSPVTVTDAANGEVEYELQDGDTQRAGNFKGEFVVTYADGEITVPNNGFIPVIINPDAQGGIQ